MEDFIKVAEVGEIEPGKGKLFRHNGVFIAVFNSWGAYYAVEGHCTGCGAVLSECEFQGSLVTCQSDEAAFYLPAGTYMGLEALRPLISFRVHIDNDQIKVKAADPDEALDDLYTIEPSADLDGVPMGQA